MVRIGVRVLLAIAVGAALPVPISIGVATALAKVARDAQFVDNCLREGREKARASPKKLLIVAGSNAGSGISAEQLSRRLNISVVNVGCHAGLGRRYILHYAREILQPGDLVLLPLEYNLYMPDSPWHTKNLHVLAHDRAYLLDAGFIERLQLLYGSDVTYWLSQLAAARRSAATIHTSSTAGTQHQESQVGVELAQLEARLKREHVPYDLVADESIQELTAFANFVESRGGHVAVTFPNILGAVMQSPADTAYLSDMQQKLASAGLTILGAPEGAFFGIEEMDDTIYHVLVGGRTRNTERLALDLEQSGLLRYLRK